MLIWDGIIVVIHRLREIKCGLGLSLKMQMFLVGVLLHYLTFYLNLLGTMVNVYIMMLADIIVDI